MTEFKSRVKEIREGLGMSMARFSDLVGLSTATISRYESGDTTVGLDVVERIAKLTGVSPGWLMGWDSHRYGHIIGGNSDVVAIPILGRISAGSPSLAVEDFVGYEYSINGVDFCLKVSGDSMIGARIYDGDIVFVKRQSDVDNGSIAVVMINDSEATVKRVYKFGDKVVLHPENPTMQDVILAENDGVRIIGKVVAVKFKVG